MHTYMLPYDNTMLPTYARTCAHARSTARTYPCARTCV